MARFVYKKIVTRFGIPFKMISNNGLQFISEVIEKLMKKLSIKHRVTTIYISLTPMGWWNTQTKYYATS